MFANNIGQFIQQNTNWHETILCHDYRLNNLYFSGSHLTCVSLLLNYVYFAYIVEEKINKICITILYITLSSAFPPTKLFP